MTTNHSRRRLRVACAVLVLSPAAVLAGAAAPTSTAPTSAAAASGAYLRRLFRLERALEKPSAERRALARRLVDEFRRATDEDETIRLASLLGIHRIQEAVEPLAERLTFRTDLLNDNQIGYWGRYPAAGALIEIGPPADRAMIKVLAERDDPDSRRLALLVLDRILGEEEAAQAALSRAASKEADPAKQRRLLAAAQRK